MLLYILFHPLRRLALVLSAERDLFNALFCPPHDAPGCGALRQGDTMHFEYIAESSEWHGRVGYTAFGRKFHVSQQDGGMTLFGWCLGDRATSS